MLLRRFRCPVLYQVQQCQPAFWPRVAFLFKKSSRCCKLKIGILAQARFSYLGKGVFHNSFSITVPEILLVLPRVLLLLSEFLVFCIWCPAHYRATNIRQQQYVVSPFGGLLFTPSRVSSQPSQKGTTRIVPTLVDPFAYYFSAVRTTALLDSKSIEK